MDQTLPQHGKSFVWLGMGKKNINEKSRFHVYVYWPPASTLYIKNWTLQLFTPQLCKWLYSSNIWTESVLLYCYMIVVCIFRYLDIKHFRSGTLFIFIPLKIELYLRWEGVNHSTCNSIAILSFLVWNAMKILKIGSIYQSTKMCVLTLYTKFQMMCISTKIFANQMNCRFSYIIPWNDAWE